MDKTQRERIPKTVIMRLAGQSLRDIARELDVTPETIRADLRYARESKVFGLNITIAPAKGLDTQAVATALRTYLDSIGLYRFETKQDIRLPSADPAPYLQAARTIGNRGETTGE